MFSFLLNQLHIRLMSRSLLISILLNLYSISIIIDSIRELSSNSAAGPDSTFAILNSAHELAPSLLILFKQSLLSCMIAPSLERAAIVPGFKLGDRTVPSNYRPISHLLLSRFLRIVCNQ